MARAFCLKSRLPRSTSMTLLRSISASADMHPPDGHADHRVSICADADRSRREIQPCLRIPLLRQSLAEAAQVDHHALVGAAADLLGLVARADVEKDTPAVDGSHFGFRYHVLPGRGRRQMPDIDRGADRAFARLEVLANGVEGS